jgi:hypothetical protein
MLCNGSDVVDRFRGSTWPNAVATLLSAKSFTLLHLNRGQRRISWLVFSEPADSFRLFTVLDREVVGTAYWNLIFRNSHGYWTTGACARALALTVTGRHRLFERLAAVEEVFPRIGSS